MCLKIVVTLLFSLLMLFGCKDELSNNTKNNFREVKDTINVVDIRSEFRKRLFSTGIGIQLKLFDKNHRRISKFNKGDTLFVQAKYISKQFVDLVKNHSIELYHAKGDFTVLKKDDNNKYKFVIGAKADTIQIDVFLKSNKYIFNDYFLENGDIKYHIVEKIGLCRLTELPD